MPISYVIFLLFTVRSMHLPLDATLLEARLRALVLVINELLLFAPKQSLIFADKQYLNWSVIEIEKEILVCTILSTEKGHTFRVRENAG